MGDMRYIIVSKKNQYWSLGHFSLICNSFSHATEVEPMATGNMTVPVTPPDINDTPTAAPIPPQKHTLSIVSLKSALFSTQLMTGYQT